jgi:hypothetical protein
MFINPTEVSSEDFLNDGIKIGVSGAQPGEKVSITVEHAQGKVDRYTMTKEADSEGKVTFGVQAKVKAVLGTYNVRAQAESFDEPQGGSFTVLTNGTAVDEGGNGNGSGSRFGQRPAAHRCRDDRTGTRCRSARSRCSSRHHHPSADERLRRSRGVLNRIER